VRINGETYYLWRAVDHEGEVLEVFVTKQRCVKSAMRLQHHMMLRHTKSHMPLDPVIQLLAVNDIEDNVRSASAAADNHAVVAVDTNAVVLR